MKKSFLMLGVAAMALASCTNEEVLNVADSRAISFDNAFVNNSTRAAINGVADLTNFYVFAGFDGNTSNVYSNTLVKKEDGKWNPAYIAYWQDKKSYTFDAYAANAKIGNAAVDEENGTLTFSNVTIDGTNDILVANKEVTVNIAEVNPVDLIFSHTLSQVKFTFKTEIENVNFTITNVTFNNVVNKGNYAASVWTASSEVGDKQAYSFENAGSVTNDAKGSTKTLIILPQSLGENHTVTFTLKAEGALALAARTLTAKLPTIDLTEGYSYNFVATLTKDNIKDPENPDEDFKPIEFTISEENGITDWTSGGDQGLK